MRYLLMLAALSLLTLPVTAQTTGNPGFNDYTINGFGSGTTSCTVLGFTTPLVLNFQVSGPPLTPVIIFVSFAACSAGTPFGPTCQGTTLDLPLFPPPGTLAAGITDASGNYVYTISLPPISPPFTVSTQAVLLCWPLLPLFTQAYDVGIF